MIYDGSTFPMLCVCKTKTTDTGLAYYSPFNLLILKNNRRSHTDIIYQVYCIGNDYKY